MLIISGATSSKTLQGEGISHHIFNFRVGQKGK